LQKELIALLRNPYQRRKGIAISTFVWVHNETIATVIPTFRRYQFENVTVDIAIAIAHTAIASIVPTRIPKWHGSTATTSITGDAVVSARTCE
jgi:hypothetical protein